MTQLRVTFHHHEVEGSKIAAHRLHELGFAGYTSNQVARLVLLHQTRFYHNTKPDTYRKFLRKLNMPTWHYLDLLLCDRAGNKRNKHKALKTREYNIMEYKLKAYASSLIRRADLCMDPTDLVDFGLTIIEAREALDKVAAIVQHKPKHNNRMFITEFVRRHYLEKKKDDKFQRLLDW